MQPVSHGLVAQGQTLHLLVSRGGWVGLVTAAVHSGTPDSPLSFLFPHFESGQSTLQSGYHFLECPDCPFPPLETDYRNKSMAILSRALVGEQVPSGLGAVVGAI